MTADVSEPILRVRDLAVTFPTQDGPATVVDGVDMDLYPGEIVGLVGESGSGKTMTALAVMGLLPAGGRVSGGEVTFAGRDMLTMSPREMRSIRGREIGMIFQEPRRSLDPCFSIGDQVAEAVRAHHDVSRKQAWSRAVEMLERVHIPDAAHRAKEYPYQFSGGQCQRVMLAIALVCRPRLLLADEPTTALDVTVQAEMLAVLDELRREMDLAVLLVTHDLGVVAETCDRVKVMYAGQIVEQAPVVDLFEHPTHPYTSGLLSAITHEPGQMRLKLIGGTVPSPQDWPVGCRFAQRCVYAEDRCDTAPSMVHTGIDQSSRCLRASELTLQGVQA